MNTLTSLFRFVIGSRARAKARKRIWRAKSRVRPATDEPSPTEHDSLRFDDSPPGHKVRWHH